MTPTYSFDVNPVRNIVRITMAGFFRPEDVGSFRQARDRAYEELTGGPNDHLTLVDIRGMHIQSQKAVAEFTSLLASPIHASKVLAIVVSRSLARMQIHRAAASREVGYFADDLHAAERWLLSGG